MSSINNAETIAIKRPISPLKCAIMSSYYHGGITHPEGNDIQHAYAWDIYTLMAEECKHWRRRWDAITRWRTLKSDYYGETTVSFLSRCTSRQLYELCDAIHDKSDGKPIQALSTFIPELSYNPINHRAGRARRALRNTLKMATYLRERGHDVLAVETTAGSRVRGLRISSENRFVAKLNNQRTSCNYLIKNLNWAIKPLVATEAMTPIALELEPGPYFLLRDWKTLSQLTKAISESMILRDYVGFNLDIGHWMLADIKADVFSRTNCEAVMDRVVYAHLSGHHRCAHFGDLAPLEHSSIEDYQPWINGLTELWERPNSMYTGGLSLELECAKDTDLIDISCNQFKTLIDQ